MPIGNLAAGFQEIRLEQLVYKRQGDDLVANPQPPTVNRGEGDLPVIVFCAVIEADRGNEIKLVCRIVERGYGVHSPADQYDGF